MSQEKEVRFEEAMRKLEEIVGHLEAGDLPLEEALKKYEEGVRMADICSKKLSEAEKRIEVLMKTNPGKFKTAPLEENNSDSKQKKKK